MSHALRKLGYAVLLAKAGGVQGIVRLLAARLWSQTDYVWLAGELDSVGGSPSCDVSYRLEPAGPEGCANWLDGLGEMESADVYEILRRVSFFERAMGACYLAVTDAGEICHVAWLLSSGDNELICEQYPPGMRELEDGVVLLENVFTFPRYRKKGIMTSVTIELMKLARREGFRRMVAYVDRENAASLRAFRRAGFRPLGGEQEVRRLFRIRRRPGVFQESGQAVGERGEG